MADQQKTSKKAGIVLISSMITSLRDPVILIVLARLLDTDMLGDVFKLILFYKTAVLVGNFGFNDNPYYFLPKLNPSAWGSFLFQCMKILFLSGVAASVISLVFFWYFFHNVWIGLLFIPVITIELTTSLTPDFLVASGRVNASSAFNLTLTVLNVGMVIGACLYFDDKILYLTYGFLIYNAVRMIFTLALAGKQLRRDRDPLPGGLLREQLDFGIPLGISNLTLRINKSVDNYIVAFFFPSAVFAEYTIGSWELPVILKIPYSITAVYLAKYTRLFDEHKITELRDKWLQVTEKIILLIVPITTFFLVYAESIMRLVFVSDYPIAVVVFQIFTLTLYMRVSSYSGLMKSFGDSKFILKSSLWMVGLNFIFGLTLAQLIGIYGPPIGTLAANLVIVGVMLSRISSRLQVPLSDLMPYRFHFYTTLISFVTVGLTKWVFSDMVVAPLIHDNVLQISVSAVFYLIVFFILASAFKILKREDRHYVLEFLKMKKTPEYPV